MERDVKRMDLFRIAATVAVAVLMVEGFKADEPKLHSVWQLRDGKIGRASCRERVFRVV